METVIISRDEFEEFKRLQIRYRWDWPAVFSANCHGEIWPFVSYGYTPGEYREEVRGLCRTIDAVADDYLEMRREGGRFFINETGAFYKDQSGEAVPFAAFQIRG